MDSIIVKNWLRFHRGLHTKNGDARWLASQQNSSMDNWSFIRCTVSNDAQSHSGVWTCPTKAMDSLAQIVTLCEFVTTGSTTGLPTVWLHTKHLATVTDVILRRWTSSRLQLIIDLFGVKYGTRNWKFWITKSPCWLVWNTYFSQDLEIIMRT